MLLRFFRKICLVVSTVALAACGQTDLEERGPIVLAAASMQGALEDVADAWEARGHARPVLSFSATPAIARQLEQGAPADLVVTADAEWMDWLSGQDLIVPESRRDIASNSLVLVGRALDVVLPGDDLESMLSEAELREFPVAARSLAIAEPGTVPAGRYAKRALIHGGYWERASQILVPTENVRAALALVERGEAELGIVYATDALASTAVWARALPMPDGDTIRYPAAMVAATRHEDSAAFLAFLAGDEAQAIFLEHGFLPAP